jgi:hypothetical protein
LKNETGWQYQPVTSSSGKSGNAGAVRGLPHKGSKRSIFASQHRLRTRPARPTLAAQLHDALSLTDMAAGLIADLRTGRNGRNRLAALLRQSIFSRLAGYEDINDVDRLCRDPVTFTANIRTSRARAPYARMAGFTCRGGHVRPLGRQRQFHASGVP